MKYKDYIGVFDSGVGGLSVLNELTKVLPNENFIYYGDLLGSPYGDKTKEEIINLSMNIAQYLISEGVKAIVIACNTATSAAATNIREKYKTIPIIGLEPAIKPAAKNHPGENILIMLTEATKKLEKFNNLESTLKAEANFIPVACSGLAEAIDNNLDVTDLLKKYLLPYKGKTQVVVLGCTHYPFIKKEIKEILGDVEFYDGAMGAAQNLKKQLIEKNIINSSSMPGKIIFECSKNVDLYEKYMEKSQYM